MPPNWGKDNIGSGKAWTSRGPYTDSFGDTGPADIYYATPTSPPGLCVINAHGDGNSAGLFDVICQGTNGKACFWEGSQPAKPPNTPTNIALLGGSWTSGGGPLLGGGNPACTTCHAGENVFIGHYKNANDVKNSGDHPLNLFGTPGWMPAAWYDPLGPSEPLNPGPDTFAGYPPSNSSPGCLTCHSSPSTAGRFPRMATPDFSNNFCTILDKVTNLPGSQGGMPPGNTCTPDMNCAKQNDPFVIAMLGTCTGMATSRANSPVAFEAYSYNSPYLGSWDHAMADKYSGSSHVILLLDNPYNGTSFQGWGETNYTSKANTKFRTSMYLKDWNPSNLAVAATDPFGNIYEFSMYAGHRLVTSNSPVRTVGSPSAYVRDDGVDAIAFRGADSQIYESYLDGSGVWYTELLPDNGVLPQGDPIGYNRGSSSSVVYKCGQQMLCEERLVYGVWYPRQIPTAAKVKAFVPMPLQTSYNGLNTIFYTGVDGVHAIADPCEPWYSCSLQDTVLYYDSTIVSAPIPYNDQNGGTSVVYIADEGGANMSSVVQLSATSNSGWSATTLVVAQKSTETLVGDPAAYVASAPWLNTILFRNSAGGLYQLQWSYQTNSYVKTTIPL